MVKKYDISVLYVEDDEFIREELSYTLERKVSKLFVAKNGEEGFELYKKEKPDLILMDIQMPYKNGYETTAEIRLLKKYNKTPIIALTAGIVLGEKEKCLELGMDDYVSKPIVRSKLEEVLYKWLKKESQNENK